MSKNIQVIRKSDQLVLVSELKIADDYFSRLKGWMFKSGAHDGEGIWILPCNSVHTWMMNFSIDVVFLGREQNILKLASNVRPWRFLPVSCWGARSVLELPAGSIQKHQLREGEVLCIAS